MHKDDFSRRVIAAQGSLYRIASSYLRAPQDRLDAISEAILKAWDKRATLRNPEYFDTWLIRILIRECINLQRRQKRTLLVSQIPEAIDRPSENPQLRLALDALPEALRIVTVLHYMEGYPVDDIARALRTSKGAVCSRLSRARQKLRLLLKEEML